MKEATKIFAGIVIVAAVAGLTTGGLLLLNQPAGSQSLTVTDYAGRTVTIYGEINTIASNYPIATEVILFLGGETKLSGSDSSCLSNAFMLNLYPNLENATDLGYPWSVNIEAIVALDPDVFVMAGTSEETADELTDLGVPTVCLSFETPEDFNYALTILGLLLDNEAEATIAVEYYTEMAQLITNETSGLANASKPDVLFLSYGAQKVYAFKTPGAGMLQNNLINMSGGISVSAELPGGWNDINMETVATWNPDIIIVTSYASNVSATDLKNDIMSDDAWNVTDAKLNGDVYAFAKDWGSWDAPTPKWILGLCWLGKFIQPTIFSSFNLTSMAEDFYNTFYNITYAEAGITGDMAS